MHRIAKSSHHSARAIRDTFLKFFIQENGHQFIRSSPVVPFCDPTVAFVNAGMNQFKNVFLGKSRAPCQRAANSQKCIRVGGKHNDLDAVGTDSYHHTFFEMLGNWSFGDYFKRDACEMAYRLLTSGYGIDPRRLFFTYFAGDDRFGLPADEECREIWRALGVPAERVLPFGRAENFWTMGETGPCGPCTEIHFDHGGGGVERARLVNAGLPSLIELWNVVFIEFDQASDGALMELPSKHIDTGMGLERLVAVLQGRESNYDTDLFVPVFEGIQTAAGCAGYEGRFDSELDTAYRIIADHSRMVTACLADQMFPEANHKLRKILRRALLLSESSFNCPLLMLETVPRVVELLGDAYPEMQRHLKVILQIVRYEAEVYRDLRAKVVKQLKNLPLRMEQLEEFDLLDYPGFVDAYRDLQKRRKTFEGHRMPGSLAYRLYSTFGLDEEAIDRFCRLEGLEWSRDDFREEERLAKMTTKGQIYGALDRTVLSAETVQRLSNVRTDDSFKYLYSKQDDAFIVAPLEAQVLAVVETEDRVHIVTDKSNFYVESGGQEGDRGVISKGSLTVPIDSVRIENDLLIHSGPRPQNASLHPGDSVTLLVDEVHRTGNILHHSATHLLNACVRSLCSAPVCQRSSAVHSNLLKLQLSVLAERRLDRQTLVAIEQAVRDAIRAATPLQTTQLDAQQLLALDDVITVPGEVYPSEGLRLVTAAGSRELCCGTHALSTGDLVDFCLVGVKLTGRSSYVFRAVVGASAVAAHAKGAEMLAETMEMKRKVWDEAKQVDVDRMEEQVTQVKAQLKDSLVPYCVRMDIAEALDEISWRCKKIRGHLPPKKSKQVAESD